MKYIFRKLISLAMVLFASSILVFLLIHMIPGDPAEIMAPLGSSAEEIEAIRIDKGLDKPLTTQYITWIGKIVLEGDFGDSLYSGTSVADTIGSKLKNTLILALTGIILAIGIGIPLGIVSAIKQNSVLDLLCMGVSIIGVSMPIFWIGLLLVMWFSVDLCLLPATGGTTAIKLILPTITIALNSTAVIARMTRSSMLEVMKQDYVRTAEAKGMTAMTVIFKHILKNAMIPIITTIGIQFGYLMGGAVLTETVFLYPGIGRLIVDSICRRDYPTIQACMLLLTTMFVVINSLIDITYHFFDPKMKER